jgi:hypothetical protein
MLQCHVRTCMAGMRSNQRLRLPAATFPGGVMWGGVFENCHAGPGCQEIGPGIDRARALSEARATLSGSAKSLASWFVIAPRLSHPQRLGTLTAPKHSSKPCNNNTGTHPRPHHGGPTACPQLAVQCSDKCAPPNSHSRSRSLRLVPSKRNPADLTPLRPGIPRCQPDLQRCCPGALTVSVAVAKDRCPQYAAPQPRD